MCWILLVGFSEGMAVGLVVAKPAQNKGMQRKVNVGIRRKKKKRSQWKLQKKGEKTTISPQFLEGEMYGKIMFWQVAIGMETLVDQPLLLILQWDPSCTQAQGMFGKWHIKKESFWFYEISSPIIGFIYAYVYMFMCMRQRSLQSKNRIEIQNSKIVISKFWYKSYLFQEC